MLSSFADVAGNVGGGDFLPLHRRWRRPDTAHRHGDIAAERGTGLPVNTRIIAMMSEAIDPSSVSNGSIQLTPAAAGTVTLSADRITLTFVPSGNRVAVDGLLGPGQRPAGRGREHDGARFLQLHNRRVGTPDTTPPAIVGRTPTLNAAGVAVTRADLHD